MFRLVLFALLLIGCTEKTVSPGTPCFEFDETCSENQSCVDSGCHFNCSVEGDCDPGYHCIDRSCLPSCKKDEECRFPAVCRKPEISRSVKTCLSGAITYCIEDDDCPGVCDFGICTIECDDESQCASRICDRSEGNRRVCFISF